MTRERIGMWFISGMVLLTWALVIWSSLVIVAGCTTVIVSTGSGDVAHDDGKGAVVIQSEKREKEK